MLVSPDRIPHGNGCLRYLGVSVVRPYLSEFGTYSMQGQNLKQINDAKINEVLAHAGLSVLLITSTWDGHGIIMRTLLEGLSNRYSKVFFGVADVEDSPRICKVFNVTNPPGLLFVKDGELIERAMGPIGGSGIIDLIERNS